MKTWLKAEEIKNRKFIQKTLCVCADIRENQLAPTTDRVYLAHRQATSVCCTISEEDTDHTDDTEGGNKSYEKHKNLRDGLTVRETAKEQRNQTRTYPSAWHVIPHDTGWPAIPSDPFPTVSPDHPM